MARLLRNAGIPLLLLDGELRVVDHAGPLADLVRLPAEARGAALSDLGWTPDMDWLPAVAARVVAGGAPEERMVQAPGGACHVVRVLPWRASAEDAAVTAIAFQPLGTAGRGAVGGQGRDAGLQRLKHQLANAVPLIRSVIRRSADTADGLADYVLHLEARLDSINRVLAAVARDPNKTFTLRELIEDELEAQGVYHVRGARLVSGPDVALRAAAAQVMALLIQELVTNAFQHGRIGSDEGGELRILWIVTEGRSGPQLQLDWRESGPVAPPLRQGFGTAVLETVLSYQLDGTATRSFDPDGLQVRLTIPMASLTGDGGEAIDV